MTTPPPTRLRAHTPPTPIHGPRLDAYHPYSPRRSTRSAHHNPYSSFNSDRSQENQTTRATTPPATAKKARFARTTTQLSSPPSSPASPVQRQSLHNKTPRKPRNDKASQLGPDHLPSFAISHLDPAAMLPTPAKTPSRRRIQLGQVQNTARILHFQPDSPSDVMPTPQRLKKTQAGLTELHGFELDEDDVGAGANGGIEIYTDANARVPELDGSDDNPFVGKRKPVPTRNAKRTVRKSTEELTEEAKLEEAVKRDEGVWFVHRGRKIFRPFTSTGDGSEGPSDDGLAAVGIDSLQQRALRRNVGEAAMRPLTRTSLKPRRLFATAKAPQPQPQDDDDEEALTDIENPNERNAAAERIVAEEKISLTHATPVKSQSFKPVTPPTTLRVNRKRRAETDLQATVDEDAAEPESPGTPAAQLRRSGRHNPSPFDSWPRTKADKSHTDTARASVSSKRARNGVGESLE